MKKHLLLYFIIILFAASPVLLADNKLYWQAIKINSHDHVEPQYGISVRVIVPNTKACYLKGPLMDEYISGEWFKWFDAWNIQVYPISLSDLQSQSFGQWELKLVFDDDQESIYTFEISGTLEDSEFLPLPEIIKPVHQSPNIIGQDSVLQWNPNDAYLDAHLLMLEMTGEDYSYFSSLVYFNDDISITQWNPGWLGFGEAYAKVGYVLVYSNMMQQVSLVSGPVIDWDTTTVFLVSGAKNDFTVKFSLDYNGDNGIGLDDVSFISAQWLSQTQENSADFNEDEIVDLFDLSLFLEHWMDRLYPSSYYLDDFNDNAMGSIWTLMDSNPSEFWLDETSQRLEVRATASSNNDLALYIPNNWYLDTSQNFGFKIQYHNEVLSTNWSELLFALGNPTDIEDNHLQFSVCSYTRDGYSGPLFYHEYVKDGSWIDDLYIIRGSTDGWIFVSYDAVLDKLYFGIEGYGPFKSVKTISGLLQGDWAGKQIAPHIGGSSDQVEMSSGQAYWDNLIIDYGEVISN